MSKITMRRSTTAGAKPTTAQMAEGELAINVADGLLYFLRNLGGVKSIVEIGHTRARQVTDWNDAIDDGPYWGDNAAANAPTSAFYRGQVWRENNGTRTQMVFRSGGLNDVYARNQSGGVWQPWVRIITGDNLPAQMASVLNAAGAAPIFAARAWVNFTGTGVVAIKASGNVSSVTDNGVGNYTVNFATAMQDAKYSAQVSSGGFSRLGALAAGSVQVFTHNVSSTSVSLVDYDEVSVAVFR